MAAWRFLGAAGTTARTSSRSPGGTTSHARASTPARRGFTAVELLWVCVVVALLATIAWPSYRQYLLRAGRGEAVRTLMQLHTAQEQHREMFGTYAAQLAELARWAPPEGFGAGTSTTPRYALAFTLEGPETYAALASVRAEGPQHDDGECPALTLRAVQGFVTTGPDGRCWNR
jgi:type IV pilus assembly protein PilE